MKIGLQTWGSDGDILPFMALAHGLRNAGHDVRLAVTSIDNKNYQQLGEELGVPVVPANPPFEIAIEEFVRQVLGTKDQLKQLAMILESYFDPVVSEMFDASMELCEENDLVIGHFFSHTLLTASILTGRPRCSVPLSPGVVRTRYESPLGFSLGPVINTIIWKIADRLMRKNCFLGAARFRSEKGLPPIRSLQNELYISNDLTLLATSPLLTPPRADWGKKIQVCGFFNNPGVVPDWEMPSSLRRFLADGEAPVYLTFGSFTQLSLQENARLFVEALNRSGKRGIVQVDPEQISVPVDREMIYCLDRAPHEEIFPYCSAVLHHGGAGTTQTSLRAGRPSIVVEHAFDQSYWGGKLKQVGVAGELLHRRSVDPRSMADAIRSTVEREDLKRQARILGEKMQLEDGVGKAVQEIESRFG